MTAEGKNEDTQIADGDQAADGGQAADGDQAAAEAEGVTAAAQDDTAADSGQDTPEAQLAAARAEAEENRDRYLRAAAELDNYRKRTVRMRAETRDETLRDVLLQVGPMLDNFRRALGQETDDVVAFRQGMDIIFRQFTDILTGYGLVEIDAEGKPFDPNLHEAMVQVPTDEHPPGTVIQEMEKGYLLNDRVVRPARVVVSAAKTADEDDGDGDASTNA